MLHFQPCEEVPAWGGRAVYGGGLVEVKGRVVWGRGGGVYWFDKTENQWKRWIDSIIGDEVRLCACEGSLVSVGGVCGREVMVWKKDRWSLMPDMLVGCMRSSVVSVGGGGLVVMGGADDAGRDLNVVQVFDGKTQTWHFGPPLPKPCSRASAAVHGDQVIVMGCRGMARAVWCANINDLVSHRAFCSISVPFFYCV